MVVRRGVAKHLEDEADRLIRESLKGVTSYAEKSDIITYWKQQTRRRREIFVPSGTPDPALRKGMYRRAYNPQRPELNSRDGVTRSHRTSSLLDFVEEHGGGYE